MPVTELTFRRAAINLADAARLGEGEDLNDALLDFFMKLGQSLIPKGGDDVAPVSYLGSLFFKQLTSAFVNSGEEGWKHVQNWSKRKAGGIFKPSYAAMSVPINEELKDDKGQPAGNHWWLALVLNPPGGAKQEPTAVMCLDSMQRREKVYDPPQRTSHEGSKNLYTIEVSKIEQAGYLLIVSFDARGDGSFGPLHRPERSFIRSAEGVECRNPELGLRINMGGGDGVQGRFDGTLTFGLDGKIRSSAFTLHYAGAGFPPIRLEFDPFQLTKMQKNVSRFLGGYLAKEWETNGPAKSVRFDKTSARALVADVHQQENLNDCGVFVLENTLRSLSMKPEFLKTMAQAKLDMLKSFPWPTQQDITVRKQKLKAIVARMFEVAAEVGSSDVEKLFKGNEALRLEALLSLTDERESELDKWSGQLQKELARVQVNKEEVEAEKQEKEAAIQARREEEKRRKEEEEAERKREEEAAPALPKNYKGKRKRSSSSRSASRSRSRRKEVDKKKKKKAPSAGDSRSRSRAGKKAVKGGKRTSDRKKEETKRAKKRGRGSSESEEPADSRSRSRARNKNKHRR